MRIYLNDDWKFYFDKDKPDYEIVKIPHTVKVTPYNAFDESIYQTEALYEKEIEFKEELKGKRVILHLEGAAHKADIFVNEKFVLTHKCGYTHAEADITEVILKEAGRIKIKIYLDTRESLNQPPFGNVIDYMTYGGIYRDVYLDIRNDVYIKSTYFYFSKEGEQEGKVDCKLVLGGNTEKEVNIKLEVKDPTGKVISGAETLEGVFEDEEGIFKKALIKVKDISLWEPDNPVLYSIEAELIEKSGARDEISVKTGFRVVEWKGEGFFLNGRKVKLRGVNRHQSYPYFGYAMPDQVQIEDVDIIKKELGMNAVRTSHYPQSEAFMEKADEAGLLVFTEMPGWQHIGDENWKEEAKKNVKDMLIYYRNHPSIILWGVRINESMDDDEFYGETNRLAKAMAPGIFTGGVRFLQKSSLLEDVYTYNDFLYNGKTKGASEKKEVTPDILKAYLVSEYNGHMFPTKPWDDEIHKTEHALRHVVVLNEIYKNEDISGGFAWCMFDYNTHKDFGSGDRICYHGLMDMFRNEKPAAYFYKSQADLEPVLFVSSDMNIGEYPGGDLRKVYVFTNLDSVKLYKNGEFIKEFFPDRKNFGTLPHPPVVVDDFVGELILRNEGYSLKTSKRIKKLLNDIIEYGMNALPLKSKLLMARMMLFDKMTISKGYELFSKYAGGWGDKVKIYDFVGIKDGKEVMKVTKSPTKKVSLMIRPGALKLIEKKGYTASMVRFKAVNQNGGTEYYINEAVKLRAEGSIEIMGPEEAMLRGGMGGTFVKSKGLKGKGILYISFRDEERVLEFEVL